MKAGIYARVSTGQQVEEGTSLDSQVKLCMNKAKQLGFSDEQIQVYREEGMTGEDIDIRPAMTKLRHDVADGIITHIIITHPDRLSRDMTDKLIVCREFEKNGAELIFTDTEFSKTPEGILFFNIISAIAAYELALIKKRTIRGRLQAVEKDKKIMPMRVAPYGYDWLESKLVINEQEAEFVRKIYRWYVFDNLTLREIGEKLYKMGAIPKRKESPNWSASSIRRILTSEIYIGKFYYNRRKTKKVRGERTETGKPKKTYEYRDESDWICIEVPAIIDPSLFDMAQVQKDKNTRKAGNVKYQYLLKGLIKCSCGRTWEATAYSGRINKETGERKKYLAYRCPNLAPKKYGPEVKKCIAPSIRADEFEAYIWNLIVETLSDPEDYRFQLKENLDTNQHDFHTEIEKQKRRLHDKEKQKEKVKYMFLEDLIDQEAMKKDIEKLNRELKEIESEIKKYETLIETKKNNALTKERIEEMIKAAQKLLTSKDALAFEERRYIIEKLVDQILIDYTKAGEFEVKIVGALEELFGSSSIRLKTQP
ncbi:recombinase family protein [Aneurinibacillus thermoaerophilus]|uniref:recombinase family protein n=1 Tax=Aneurinibacillus thermoaerophilus TaxID=143495 RepID=UPI002E1E5BD1|nr:recombinase family protein [Aneurinibacillus thermoaerophilus]MED0676520.1 recombinase family protein [Aneurinibacillus thermoaerophilus]MED0681167.1 recombinase family protein [Aneurinibacillus thermoaerophilus]MED0735644.1 recombinase family protein [Aneurinibacillus thermoaerophilus]MED0766193.1 recombinase family protein [Aneurinibacillus thermoaerophilus]